MKHIVGAGLFFTFLFIGADADAVCGDVTGDGKRAASDALAVLRAATGQPIDLVCDGDGPSELRFYNDFQCDGGAAVSQASFNGFTFTASSGELSEYQSVDRDTIDTIAIALCGGEYNFPGPINLPPGRNITFYMALLNPAVYGDAQALFVLYDDGEPAAAYTLLGATDATPASGIGYAFGSSSSR